MKVSPEKAWKAYQKNLKGLPENKANPNRMTKAQFMQKHYPSQTERGLAQAGLSYREIAKLKGNK